MATAAALGEAADILASISIDAAVGCCEAAAATAAADDKACSLFASGDGGVTDGGGGTGAGGMFSICVGGDTPRSLSSTS